MKKLNIILIISLSILLFSACGKDWLEEIEPQGQLFETNYYQTEDEAYAGLIATYSMWRTKYFMAWSSWYIQAALPADDEVTHGGGRSDRPEYWEMDDYLVTSDNPANLQTWDRCYYGLYRANLVINNSEPSSANMKQIIAEAKFLRAWFLFDIVRFWGEAPLYTTPLGSSEYNQAKKPMADFFTQITKDLQEAIPDLPATRQSGDRYRVTSFGAQSFLGKVYLYMASPYYNTQGSLGDAAGLYAKAAEQFAPVVASPNYRLLDNYDDIWNPRDEFNDESIVEISFSPAPVNGWLDGSASEGNIDVQLCGVRGTPGDTFRAGWGFDMFTQELINQYKAEGDSERLHGAAIAEWQVKEWANGVATLEKNEAYTGYYCKKRQTWFVDGGAQNWTWGQNERVIRLGDVYLMYAEALLGSGNATEAAVWMNKVRDRAGLGDKPATLENIKAERRLELAGEGQRFFDLVRWGDAATVLTPLGYVANKNEHYPIPQRDIDASKGVLVQRAGF